MTSSFYLESNATAVVEGVLDIASSAYADIYFDATLTVESGGTWDIYGYCYLEDGSEAVLYGDLHIDNSATLNVIYYGLLTVTQSGAAYIYGTLSVDYYGRAEVFGWLGVATTGWMYLDYQSIVNVYRDIRIGGRLVGYGGKIVMLRREGRILDFNDNLLFVIDRAYGFGQTRIA